MPNNNDMTAFFNGSMFRPTTKTLIGQALIDLENKIQQTQRKVSKVDKSTGAPKVVQASAPKQLISVTATESPSTQIDRTFSQVGVSFTRDPSDQFYAGVDIWFIGYKGNSQPVLISSGADSPIIFLCETTKEVITVVAQPFSAGGIRAPFAGAKRTALALDGVVSAPPAPSIAQSTVTITNGGVTQGQQFQFNFLPTSVSDVVMGYWVYRVGSHVVPTPPASRWKFVLNNSQQQGIYTLQDLSGVSTNFYYVSAVNKAGLESSLTDAASGVTNTFRPTASTVISGGGFSNPSNAWDGNATTYASATVNFGGTAIATSWQGIGSLGTPSTVKLKITSQAGNGGLLACSTDGGSTYTTVRSGAWSQVTDSISLSNSVVGSNIRVKAQVSAPGVRTVSNSEKVYEIWVETT